MGPIDSAVLTLIGYKQTDNQAKDIYKLLVLLLFLLLLLQVTLLSIQLAKGPGVARGIFSNRILKENKFNF